MWCEGVVTLCDSVRFVGLIGTVMRVRVSMVVSMVVSRVVIMVVRRVAAT